MKSSHVSQNSQDNGRDNPNPKPSAGILGKLSRTEAFLYNGARAIDQAIDAILDRPRMALAIAALLLGVAVSVSRA